MRTELSNPPLPPPGGWGGSLSFRDGYGDGYGAFPSALLVLCSGQCWWHSLVLLSTIDFVHVQAGAQFWHNFASVFFISL